MCNFCIKVKMIVFNQVNSYNGYLLDFKRESVVAKPLPSEAAEDERDLIKSTYYQIKDIKNGLYKT